jgi:hypothetical protein
MTTRKQKQVAYNERVLKAEEEIGEINSDIPEFLSEMNATDSIVIAINAGQPMRRGEEVMGGQYWQQGGRRMTASNHILQGMPNTRTSAILPGAQKLLSGSTRMRK